MTHRLSLPFVAVAVVCLVAAVTAEPAQSAVHPVVIQVNTTLGPPPDFFGSGPFTATAPLCPAGQTVDTFRFDLGSDADSADVLVGKRFTCADGSGTFDATLLVHVSFASGARFLWAITGGTGSYRGLRGFGRGTGTFTPNGIFDTYTGYVFTP